MRDERCRTWRGSSVQAAPFPFPVENWTGLDCSVRVTSGSQRRAGLTSLRLSTGGGAGVTKGSRRQRDVRRASDVTR